jgi:hypothetical protein
VPTFLQQGGSNVEGQFVQIGTNPFEDSASIPAMKRYLAPGGPQNESGSGVLGGLLFETAARQVVLSDGRTGSRGRFARQVRRPTTSRPAESGTPGRTACRTAAS